jgi:hypothetical protein
MKTLQISETLSLPLDTVTDTLGVLAIKGAGKTYTFLVLVEEMVKRGFPVVVLDPVGVCWGLRLDADGKSKGLDVLILGGRNGDVPLASTAGKVIADFVIAERRPVVLDMSHFETKAEMMRFVLDFATRLYHANRDAIHVVMDEADDYCPQNPFGEEARTLRAVEVLVRRGRARGIGVTLVTQRAAAINKGVLTQISTLICGTTTSPQDRKAVKAWVDAAGTDEEKAEFWSSLARLPKEDKWVWSPGRDVFARVRIRPRLTFDSSATPKVGAKPARPPVLGELDIASLRDRIAETIERAKADDPRELRKRIAELEKQVRAKAPPAPGPAKEQRVEVPVLKDKQLASMERIVDKAIALERIAKEIAGQLGEDLLRFNLAATGTKPEAVPRGFTAPAAPAAPRVVSFAASKPTSRTAEGAPALRKGARKLLGTLARHAPVRMSRAQLATLAGFTVSGGTFQTYLSDLRRGAFIVDRDSLLECTPDGLHEAGVAPGTPMTQAEVVAQWRGALRAGARAMLDVVLNVRQLTRDELAAAVDMTVTGGTFQTYLSDLRRNGLVSVSGGTITVGDALEKAQSALVTKRYPSAVREGMPDEALWTRDQGPYGGPHAIGSNSAYAVLATMNDNTKLADSEREPRIADVFRAHGVDVTFVDPAAPTPDQGGGT